MQAELTVTTSKLGTLRFGAGRVKEELPNFQTDVWLQTTLQNEAPEQVDLRFAELVKKQWRLEMIEAELITVHGAQTEVAAKFEQLCAQIPNRTSKSVEIYSAAKNGRNPQNVRMSDLVPKTICKHHRRRKILLYAQSALSLGDARTL